MVRKEAMGGRFTVALLAVTGMLACLAPPAGADHGVLELVSTGPAPGACPPSSPQICEVRFRGASSDGRHALFDAYQPLVAGDSDTKNDLHEWVDGLLTRVSEGPAGTGFSGGALISPDGARVTFTTHESLVAEDTDGLGRDVYQRTAGELRLLSAPPGGSGVTGDVGNDFGGSPDGRRVFFVTREPLVSSDTDSDYDLYESYGETLSRLVDGPVEGSGGDQWFEGATNDGRLFFWPSAGGAQNQLFEHANGQTTLLSTGPQPAGDGSLWPGYEDSCCAVSEDGSRAAFTTTESLVAEDTDGNNTGCSIDPEGAPYSCPDVYLREAGTTTMLSHPGVCQGICNHAVPAGMTADGSHIFFTAGHFEGGNLFQWRDGTITLLAGGVPHFTPFAFSRDGSHVFFLSASKLVPEDTDNFLYDVYERFEGQTRLMSTGPADQDDCCSNITFVPRLLGAATDGSAVFFATRSKLVTEDVNNDYDVYEHSGGQTTLLSIGPSGHGGSQPRFAERDTQVVSDDGSRVFFETTQRLLPQDTDNTTDVYMARRAGTAGYPRPAGATTVRFPLVPAFAPCAAGNREHGPPLAFGSCRPPVPASANLVVSVGETRLRSIGSVRMAVHAGIPGAPDDTDVGLRFSLTNVMKAGDLSEYTGELRPQVGVRLTDTDGTTPSTTQNFPLAWSVPCAATADPNVAATCALDTTLDAVVPGAAPEGSRAIWGLERIQVYDGGPDGDADTTGDNSLFATQGIFVP